MLDSKRRKELAAAAHHLRPAICIAEDGPSPTALEQVRAGLRRGGLLKVRVQTDARAAADRVAAAIADQVPCELVRRIGFVLLLYSATGVES